MTDAEHTTPAAPITQDVMTIPRKVPEGLPLSLIHI